MSVSSADSLYFLPPGVGEGDAGELHDHANGSRGPAAWYRRCQRETGTGREEKHADPGGCGQQTTAERN